MFYLERWALEKEKYMINFNMLHNFKNEIIKII